MRLYHLVKNTFNAYIILIMLFCFTIMSGMDAMRTQVTDMHWFNQYLATIWFLPRLDLQSIGRFACVCKKTKICSSQNVLPMLSPESICFADLYRDQHYDKCTEFLGCFFKQKNQIKFQQFWNYHARKRELELRGMYPDSLNGFSPEAYMNMHYTEFKSIQNKNKKDEKNRQRVNDKDRSRLKLGLRLGQDFYENLSNLELLERDTIDIADLFPRKNDKKLLSYLCKNTHNRDACMKAFISLTNKYMNNYSIHIVDCLLEYRKTFCMLYLIENNIFDVNVRSTLGQTMLHYLNSGCACCYSHWDIYNRCEDPYIHVKSLIDRGADVNAVDNKGMTPLHYACKNLHPKSVAELLKSNKIDSVKKNNKGKKPKNYIKCYQNRYRDMARDKRIIKLLLASSATQ